MSVFFKKNIKNQNELMKTLTCTANKNVPWRVKVHDVYSERWHCIAILMILWNQEEQHSNIARLLSVYAPNSFDWHSKVWGLIDPLVRLVNSYQRTETTGR